MLQLETKSNSAITALAFSPDGMRLLVGYAKGPVQEWDAFGSLLFDIEFGENPEFRCLAWSPSGTEWMFGRDSDYCRIKGNEVAIHTGLEQIPASLSCCEYLSDELVVLGQGSSTNSSPGALRLMYPLRDARTQPKCHLESAGVRELAVHIASRTVAWLTGYRHLKIWRTDRPDKHTIPLSKTAKKVALSPDGLTVAVAVEWAILTFSTATRHPLKELKGHKGKVTSLAFSPDGRTIVTGSWDETVREWNAASGKELRCLNWKIGKIAALSYAPDGTRIAAGSTSGKVIIWDVD